ncbi:hormogonium polysaccharide biosynthesis glycosyltransferase HpsO [Oscillatoria sp. FACHB-1406]|uniref:hormogonium polysaccharide biosynthesis glycosyltransferase HpsO n=1 Tax=Oscillatoria sp. FACHB-1406 TaxID=2692846 RepID=UPI001685D609|nr:hormogonium polysaccharide biosynthesis glycosyltransferase HpsO [Oscillatoria sp. FACHB-1406]MBD2576869.1 glycosyltransferase family 4 protein [Oscillatoria sp. FACHB-1406]
MRILVASHSYIVDLNCEKLRAIANLEPDIHVTVAVPKRWKPGGVQNKIIETQPRSEGNFRVVPLSNFSENNQGLLTFGTDLIALMRDFKPQILQVEQGSKSFAYAQFILLNRLLRLKAKNVFFTWWNLPYQSKFPVSTLENYNLNNTDGAIAGNQDGLDILREHGYKSAGIVLPQLGVDEQLFSPQPQPELAAKFGIEADEFVVGFVGRFVEEKGLLTLVQALAGLKALKWKLLLLGRGPLKPILEAKLGELGIRDRALWIESVPHADVPRYINLANVLVLPSETTEKFKTLTAAGWKEQFGHVLIEAMACGVPVIGSDSGEIPHVIGEAGLIFPEKDSAALRQCLQQLMEQPELREKLGRLGYDRAMQRYTNQALAREQLAFYRKIMD